MYLVTTRVSAQDNLLTSRSARVKACPGGQRHQRLSFTAAAAAAAAEEDDDRKEEDDLMWYSKDV